jgi:hypothetical protein
MLKYSDADTLIVTDLNHVLTETTQPARRGNKGGANVALYINGSAIKEKNLHSVSAAWEKCGF